VKNAVYVKSLKILKNEKGVCFFIHHGFSGRSKITGNP